MYIDSIGGVKMVSAGARHTMATTSNHVLFVWGFNCVGEMVSVEKKRRCVGCFDLGTFLKYYWFIDFYYFLPPPTSKNLKTGHRQSIVVFVAAPRRGHERTEAVVLVRGGLAQCRHCH
jgi:hypothetical protein